MATRRTALAIVAGLAVVAVVVLVSTVLNDDDAGLVGGNGLDAPPDDGPVDAVAARSALEAVADGDQTTISEDVIELDSCPFGPIVDLAGQAVSAADLDERVLDGGTHQWANPGSGAGCWIANDELEGSGEVSEIELYARLAPSEPYEDFLEANRSNAAVDWEVEVFPAEAHLDAEIVPFCWYTDSTFLDDDCGAAWVHSDAGLVMELELTGAEDAAAAVAALKSVLQAAVDSLADAD